MTDLPVFGDITAEAAMRAVYAGVPHDRLAAFWSRHTHPAGVNPGPDELEAHGGLVVWNGGVMGRVGHYWTPNPVSGVVYARYLRGGGFDRMPYTNSGLRADAVGLLAVVPWEIDEGSVDDQLRKVAKFEAEAGVVSAALVLSGDTREASIAAAEHSLGHPLLPRLVRPGKSVHGHIALHAVPPTAENLAKWNRAMWLLARALGSDEAVISTHQPMRMPGVVGPSRDDDDPHGVRIQTCIRAGGSPAVSTLDDVIARLEGHLGMEVVAEVEAKQTSSRSWSGTGAGRPRLPTEEIAHDALVHGKTLKQWAEELGPGKKQTVRCVDPTHGKGRGDRSGEGSAYIFTTEGGVAYLACPQVCGKKWAAASAPLTDADEELVQDLLDGLLDDSPIQDTELGASEPDDDLAAWHALRQYMAHFLPRLEAREKKAEAVDPLVAACARKALDAADGWYKEIRRNWRAAGFDRRGSKCGAKRQGLGHVGTGQAMLIARNCGNVGCIFCGPLVVARKAAAILYMPIQDKRGEAVGAPMIHRPVYQHDVAGDRRSWATWKRRFQRAAKANVALPPNRDVALPPKGNTGMVRRKCDIHSGKHAYVVFGDAKDPADLRRQLVVLSTVDLGGAAIPRSEIEQTVLDLVGETYSVVPDEAVAGLHHVVGKVTSSQGLRLDPDAITKLARPSQWVVERAENLVGLAKARKRLKAIGIVAETERAEDEVIAAVTVQAPLSPSARSRMWAALHPEHDPQAIVKVTPGTTPDFELDPDTLELVADRQQHTANDEMQFWWPDEVIFEMAAEIGVPLEDEQGLPVGRVADLPAICLQVIVEDILKEPDRYPPQWVRRADLPADAVPAFSELGASTTPPSE